MPSIRIAALGGFSIDVDGRQVDWLASQRMRAACLVYLAVEREASRDRLIGLFWPESDLERARRSLSQVVYTIRRAMGESTIITDGDRVRIGPEVDVDVVRFTSAVDAGDLATALTIYRGRFLADTTLSTAAEFEQWLDARRAHLERTHRRARRSAIEQALARGDTSAALKLALDWCELDADEDEAHHRYIELLIQGGHRVEAIRHFESYVERLKASDLHPLDETVALIAALRAKQPDAAPAITRAAPNQQTFAHADTPPVEKHGIAALVDQLKRRRVIGALGLYFVLAWGAIEVSNTVFPLLNLPEWGPRLIAILAVIGIPFTLFFAWQYDLTAQGVQRTSAALANARSRAFPKWASAVVVVPVVLFGIWEIKDRFEPPPENDLVAIFPFCIAGTSAEGDAANVAVLLARGVDALPEMQSADPNLLITASEKAHLNCRDSKGASEIARQFGAARFILGTIARTDTEISADATLYDAAAKMKWAVTTKASSAGMQVVDSLVREIVEKQGSSVGNRMVSLAASMTRSNDALQAYLEGERHTRALEWDKAAENYRRAVAVDSAFGLAWLRLTTSLHDGGAPVKERRVALARAQQFASQLPDREQRALYALDPMINGRVAEAVERLRAYLAVYPDDHEAWYWLGDVESFLGGLIGHGRAETLDAYQRSSARGNANAVFMLAWEYVMAGDPRADSLLQVVRKIGAGGDWVLGLEAAHVFKRRNQAEIEKMIALIDTLPARQRHDGPNWAFWVNNFDLAERLAVRALSQPHTAEGRKQAVATLVDILESRGKRMAADTFIRRLSEDPHSTLQRRVARVTDPAYPRDPAEMRRVRDAISPHIPASLPTKEPDKYRLAENLYARARLSTALRDFTAAVTDAARLEPLTFDEHPTGGASLAAAVHAHIAAEQGDTTTALRWLDSKIAINPMWSTLPGPFRLAPERRLRAEILAQSGRYEDALRWFETLGGPYSLRRRGELYERLGDRPQAVRAYRHLRDLLAGCDPGIRPLRTFAEQRLAALER